jgi:hypothetical protein
VHKDQETGNKKSLRLTRQYSSVDTTAVTMSERQYSVSDIKGECRWERKQKKRRYEENERKMKDIGNHGRSQRWGEVRIKWE